MSNSGSTTPLSKVPPLSNYEKGYIRGYEAVNLDGVAYRTEERRAARRRMHDNKYWPGFLDGIYAAQMRLMPTLNMKTSIWTQEDHANFEARKRGSQFATLY